MFLINNDKKKKSSKGGFAEGVRALSDLLTVGTRLATMSAACMFIYFIRDGLADAFTRDFVRLFTLGGALLLIGAAYAAYKVVDRMAESAEEAAIAIAEKAKAEKEAEQLKNERAQRDNDQRVIEMQAMFMAAIGSGGQTGAKRLSAPHKPRISVSKKTKKKDALVIQ